MPETLWTLDNVTLAGDRRPRLDAVSVVVRPGITAVLGPSGAGKSSMLDLLVEYERATRGEVRREFGADAHALSVFWVPQSGGLWPHLRAIEHIEKVQCGTPAAFLAKFDLGERAQAFPDEMSQGEQARLSVARALAADAAALVMDEPLAHVDTTQAARFWDIIREHVRRTGTSLVFATHSPKTVLAEADRVICLGDGKVVYEGGVDALYHSPATRELAECLGEVNWFEPAEAMLWLGRETTQPLAVRPEQVEIVVSSGVAHPPAPTKERPSGEASSCSPHPGAGVPHQPQQPQFRVSAARFKGGIAEADIIHEPTGATRRIFHRPAGNTLRAGDRVALKLLALAMLALTLGGCGGPDGPALEFREEAHWPMPPDGTAIPAPRSLAIGPSEEVVCLDMVGRVLVFDDAGKLLRSWRMPEVGVGRPEGVEVLKDGRIAVCDTHYHRLVFFDREGKALSMLGKDGAGPGEFRFPVGVAQDEDGYIYVCEYGGNDRVQKFASDGTFVLAFGTFGMGEDQFQRPSGVATRGGKVYVADAINNRVLVFTSGGKFEGTLGGAAGAALDLPYDLEFAPDGALYVIEYGAGRLTKLSTDGRLLGRYGSAGAGVHQFRTPWGMTIDSKGRLRIADTGNHRIVDLKE